MRDRMGLAQNPLDGVMARVRVLLKWFPSFGFLNKIVDNRPANLNICSNTSSKSSPLNSALWMDRK